MSLMPPEIRLRAVEPEDAEMMLEVENDSASLDSTDHLAPLSRQQLLDYALTYDADPLRSGQLRLIAEDSDGKPVGIADLYEISAIHSRAFAAIYILPSRRRTGYALATLLTMGSYARGRLGLRRLAARILDGNTPSTTLFEKAGYTRAATLPSWHFASGRMHDMHIYIRELN